MTCPSGTAIAMMERHMGSPVRRLLLPAVTVAVAFASGRPASACDSTACAVAMRYSDGALGSGQWRIDISARHVDQSRRFYRGDSTLQVFRPRVDLAGGGFEAAAHQELSAAMSFFQVEVTRGLSSRLSASATLPLFRSTRIETLHYLPPGGSGVVDLPPEHGHVGPGVGSSFEAQNSAGGVGDLQLGLRGSIWSAGPRELLAGVTVKLPTGSSDVAGDDGVVDPMLQPGTGALDVVGSLQYVQRLGGTTLAATGSFQKATRSDSGYRYGDDAVVALGASRSLSPRLTGQLQLKGQVSGRHHYRDTAVPSTGLRLVQLAPGVRFRANPSLSVYATMQIPAYVNVNEGQLGPRVTMTAGLVKAF